MVVNSVNSTLLNHGNDRAVKELRIWDSIDNLIDFEDSDVYSYNPESDSDPNDEEGGGTLYVFASSLSFFFCFSSHNFGAESCRMWITNQLSFFVQLV